MSYFASVSTLGFEVPSRATGIGTAVNNFIKNEHIDLVAFAAAHAC